MLGPLTVRGLDRPFTRAAARDLVVYLALHPGEVRNDVWASALWPDRPPATSTLHSVASSARRALGSAGDGRPRLPHAHGSLAVRSVTTDWARFVALSAGGGPAEWAKALRLVRGRPFEGLGRPDWAVLEGAAAEVEERVVEVATRLATQRLATGDGWGAARAARRGLRASPYDERLFRLLLEAADRQGNPEGVESVMAELLSLLGDGSTRRAPAAAPGWPMVEVDRLVHPQTAQLYHALSRRGGATGETLARL